MHALVDAGADIIELGVPFSDPMADGPVIQRASERALAQGVGLADVLDLVAQFRARDATTPVVLMGYANPIEAMGVERVRRRAQRRRRRRRASSSTIRRRRRREFAALLRARGIAPIFLLAPTTPEARIAAHRADRARLRLLRVAEGRHRRRPSRRRRGRDASSREIRRHVALPVGVGFGIRDAASAQRDRRARRRGRHRQPHHPGDRARRAGGGRARAGAWLATIRRALDACAVRRVADASRSRRHRSVDDR